MQAADDREVFALAEREDRVLISADSDFGTLLALYGKPKPSVILFRRVVSRRPEAQVALLLDNLASIADDLASGSAIGVRALSHQGAQTAHRWIGLQGNRTCAHPTFFGIADVPAPGGRLRPSAAPIP
jgi:predicted nuclease of predicted toxin-antitoxin system